MKKFTFFALAAALAAGTYAAVKLMGEPDDLPEEAPPERDEAGPVPVDPNRTVAFPLKNKYANHVQGKAEPVYLFELDTPSGVKEVEVTEAHYETYYIGDEVICLETDGGLLIV